VPEYPRQAPGASCEKKGGVVLIAPQAQRAGIAMLQFLKIEKLKTKT